jgi:hypothetical protein
MGLRSASPRQPPVRLSGGAAIHSSPAMRAVFDEVTYSPAVDGESDEEDSLETGPVVDTGDDGDMVELRGAGNIHPGVGRRSTGAGHALRVPVGALADGRVSPFARTRSPLPRAPTVTRSPSVDRSGTYPHNSSTSSSNSNSRNKDGDGGDGDGGGGGDGDEDSNSNHNVDDRGTNNDADGRVSHHGGRGNNDSNSGSYITDHDHERTRSASPVPDHRDTIIAQLTATLAAQQTAAQIQQQQVSRGSSESDARKDELIAQLVQRLTADAESAKLQAERLQLQVLLSSQQTQQAQMAAAAAAAATAPASAEKDATMRAMAAELAEVRGALATLSARLELPGPLGGSIGGGSVFAAEDEVAAPPAAADSAGGVAAATTTATTTTAAAARVAAVSSQTPRAKVSIRAVSASEGYGAAGSPSTRDEPVPVMLVGKYSPGRRNSPRRTTSAPFGAVPTLPLHVLAEESPSTHHHVNNHYNLDGERTRAHSAAAALTAAGSNASSSHSAAGATTARGEADESNRSGVSLIFFFFFLLNICIYLF